MQQNTPQIDVFIITHIAYNKKTNKPVEGPYTSVANAIHKIYGKPPAILEIPLNGFEGAIVYGELNDIKLAYLPKVLGLINPVKYIVDLLISFFYGLFYLVKSKRELIIIGIDPLSTLSFTLLRKFLSFKLVYYCVDFSKNRTANKIMQSLYEYADRVCSENCDQVWVVCESLRVYKKDVYGVESIYVPNSFPFDESFYKKNHQIRDGRTLVWMGSTTTEKQVDYILDVCQKIQFLRPDFKFVFAPSNRQERFQEKIQSRGLKNSRILFVHGQKETSEIVSKCDVGLAIYDPEHGSTKFIEPIKIWEYMMCGLPFIVSSEPSINNEAIKAGVVMLLGPGNEVPTDGSLQNFIDPENLKNLTLKSIELAQKFDALETVRKAFVVL